MTRRLIFLLSSFLLLLVGCSDDISTICERLVECEATTASVDMCVDELDREVEDDNISDNALEDCAECADAKSCSDIEAGECNAACASLVAMLGS